MKTQRATEHTISQPFFGELWFDFLLNSPAIGKNISPVIKIMDILLMILINSLNDLFHKIH